MPAQQSQVDQRKHIFHCGVVLCNSQSPAKFSCRSRGKAVCQFDYPVGRHASYLLDSFRRVGGDRLSVSLKPFGGLFDEFPMIEVSFDDFVSDCVGQGDI